MPRLIWSEASLRDIGGINDFLTKENPQAAARIASGIKSTVLRLLDYPRVGRALGERFRVLGVRTTPYVIIYRLRDGDVEIARIRHGSENWLAEVEGPL
ncbi:MAG: type II toxin-antitoxin system RelE/ParE family toxin [Sphingomonas sp.]|uniref:type II toxin-antitoxin system RelE/ParE family toxin n=1 Tax=Sphingomonas sp. TaxID=28214 RepID=UPI0035A90C77|nr:type II toxin-antitoxin system RelE/ParE family toxin [Sphingomonas sp.]